MEPQIVSVEPGKPPRKEKKGAGSSGMLGWMAGSSSKQKSSGKKYVSVPSPGGDDDDPFPEHAHKHKHRRRASYTSYFLYPATLWLPKFV
jgi:hypothetical protein